MKKLLLSLGIIFCHAVSAASQNADVDKVVLVFKTHLDIGYSCGFPDISEGVHFCLFNNLWSTNFNLWWEGSIRYRFHIEMRGK